MTRFFIEGGPGHPARYDREALVDWMAGRYGVTVAGLLLNGLRGFTPRGSRSTGVRRSPQIRSAYSRIARSLENRPQLATFRTTIRPQRAGSA